MMPFMDFSERPTPAPEERRERNLCLLILALLIAGAVHILTQYGTCPQDDAFISFRYAQNLVDGHGLVFNPGEWVEGYSNLSWTLIMAGFITQGVDPIEGAALLGSVSVVATLFVLLWREAHGERLRPILVLAPALLILDAEMLLEAIEGLESTFYMFLITAAVVRAWHEQAHEQPHRWSTALFALASLTRPEAPLLFGLTHVGLWWQSPHREVQLRRASWAALALGAVLAMLTLWRLQTYGAPLPNTYYAKTGGFAIPRGLQYIGSHVAGHLFLWTLVALRLALGGLERKERALLPIIAVHLAYVIWIGGDFKPTGRFILPILPLLCLLAARGLRESWTRGSIRLRELEFSTPRTRSVALLMTAICLGVASRDFHRGYTLASSWAQDRTANFHSRRLIGLFLREHFPSDTVLAIHSAGVIPYYAELPTIDMWGLSNAHIARTEQSTMGKGLAGHEKTDPEYVFSLEPHIYLPEDEIFIFDSRELGVEEGFPFDFLERYDSRSIPFPGDRVRYLNMWMRRGLLRCLNSALIYSPQDHEVVIHGRYQVSPCSEGEIQTWGDIDQDGIPAQDPSCCFAPTPIVAGLEPTHIQLRRFVLDTASEWDCNDDDPEIGAPSLQGCP
jgi:arabinofuranosyltransferase